ncbi:MAG: TolC family protein [Archangium sp.]
MFVAVLAALLAQTPARGVTLSEALARADASPSVAVSRARLAATAADERVIEAVWLPRVGAAAEAVVGTTNNSTTTLLSASAVDLPRIGATAVRDPSWTPAGSTLVALGIRQQVFDFGRTASELDGARARTDAERARQRQTQIEARVAITQSWHAVLAAHELVASAARAVERLRALREFVRAGVASKLRAPVELTRAEVEVQRAEVTVMRAEAQLASSQLLLGASLGEPSPLDAVGEPLALVELPPMERVLADASEDPRMREATELARAAALQADAVSAQWRPQVLASAALSARAGGATPSSGAVPPGGGWLPAVPNWDVGLVANWNAIDPVQWARARAANERADVARAELGLTRQTENTAAATAWLDARVLTRAVPMLQVALDGALANQQQAETRFRLGLATQLELTEAERLRTEAEIQLALGRLQAVRALAGLQRFTSEKN